MFELCIFINQITKCDVVEIMLSANKDVELLVEYSELTAAYHTAKIQFTEDPMKLRTRDCSVVYAIVILKQWKHLYTTLAHAISKTVHHFLKHLISILCELV